MFRSKFTWWRWWLVDTQPSDEFIYDYCTETLKKAGITTITRDTKLTPKNGEEIKVEDEGDGKYFFLTKKRRCKGHIFYSRIFK